MAGWYVTLGNPRSTGIGTTPPKPLALQNTCVPPGCRPQALTCKAAGIKLQAVSTVAVVVMVIVAIGILIVVGAVAVVANIPLLTNIIVIIMLVKAGTILGCQL